MGSLNATGNVTASAVSASDITVANSTDSNPVTVNASVADATGVDSFASAFTGPSWGVRGGSNSSDPTAYGVIGFADATSGDPIGVYGLAANSPAAVGIFGQNGPESATAKGVSSLFLSNNIGVGVWGDTGVSAATAVVGTADNAQAAYLQNNSPASETIVVQNYGTSIAADFANAVLNGGAASSPTIRVFNSGTGNVIEAYGNVTTIASSPHCIIDGLGDLTCTGTKNAAVPLDGGKRYVAMSAIESPQNWFEDAGSGKLVNGSATVTLDPDFVQTVNAGMDYKVFPVPNGDCKGLYVTQKTATSFEVRELGGGTSSVGFDYRIMALRRNYENVRFADRTKDFGMNEQKLAEMKKFQQRVAAPSRTGHSHMPTKPVLNPHMPTKTPPAQKASISRTTGQTPTNQKPTASNAVQ